MRLVVVFDISVFVWSNENFHDNKHKYFMLMNVLPKFLEKIKNNKVPVVFRGELLDEIRLYFPYDNIPNNYFDYQRLTLSYLTKINIIEYPDSSNFTITSNPSIIKDYFEESTQKEIKHLINYIYSEKSLISNYMTFSLFWTNGENLILSNGIAKEINTYKIDRISEHNNIILSLKKVFEHNPKHNKYKSSNFEYYGKVISSLSCFNERIGDKTKAQKLLDESVFLNGDFFNFDEDHSTYVMFVNTGNNIYHGFDIQPEKKDQLLIDKKLNNG